jgi:hypothetical protein
VQASWIFPVDLSAQTFDMEPLRLRKIRDFGATISDTILYIKIHWKPLLTLYGLFVAPFLLVAALLGANSFAGFFARLDDLESISDSPWQVLTPGFFIAIIMYLLSAVAYSTVVYLYMRQTEERGGQAPAIQETGARFLPKLLSNAGYMIIAFFLMMAMALLAIIPIFGIIVVIFGFVWLAVNLSLLFPANTVEDNAFPASFGRMFRLVRDRWWYTFGVVIIFGMIFYFFSTVISLVSSLVFGLSSVNFLRPANAAETFTKKYFLVMGLTSLIQQVFYLVVHVGVGVHYFSLREEKDGSGLEDRIEQLGTGKGPHSDIEEQY